MNLPPIVIAPLVKGESTFNSNSFNGGGESTSNLPPIAVIAPMDHYDGGESTSKGANLPPILVIAPMDRSDGGESNSNSSNCYEKDK